MSLVPTSAHSGDGMGNLIALLVELTQTMLARRLAHCDELRAQVMEVRERLCLVEVVLHGVKTVKMPDGFCVLR